MKKQVKTSSAEPPPVKIQQLRAAPPAPPRIIKRTFTLDHALGDVVVTIKGPAGAAKFASSHTSLSISTDGAPEELPTTRPVRARQAAPARELSGNPHVPGGTIEASLPGDDEGEAARALSPDALDFLNTMEKVEMRRVARE